jgi:hypothetical protein
VEKEGALEYSSYSPCRLFGAAAAETLKQKKGGGNTLSRAGRESFKSRHASLTRAAFWGGGGGTSLKKKTGAGRESLQSRRAFALSLFLEINQNH